MSRPAATVHRVLGHIFVWIDHRGRGALPGRDTVRPETIPGDGVVILCCADLVGVYVCTDIGWGCVDVGPAHPMGAGT